MGRRTLSVSPEVLVEFLKGPGGPRTFTVEHALPSDARLAGVHGLEFASVRLVLESDEWPETIGSWGGPELDSPRVTVHHLVEDGR